MSTAVKKLYEAMFLVDSSQAASDWDGLNETIRKILDRHNAQIVSMRKWDERRLTYEIKGKNRGTYILCYFNAEGGAITGIERDVQLSEKIMRALILSAESIPAEEITKDTPAIVAERFLSEQQAKAAAQAASSPVEAKSSSTRTAGTADEENKPN